MAESIRYYKRHNATLYDAAEKLKSIWMTMLYIGSTIQRYIHLTDVWRWVGGETVYSSDGKKLQKQPSQYNAR